MTILSSLLLITLLIVGWGVFWHLVRHPESRFFLEGQGFHIHFGLRRDLQRIMVLFNITETITQEDVSNLLGVTPEEAATYLGLLMDTDQIDSFEGEDGILLYERI